MLTSVVVIGHSHTPSILKALSDSTDAWTVPQGLHVEAVNLREFMPSVGLTTREVTRFEPPAPPALHPAVIAALDGCVVPGSHVCVVSMIGGNSHNVLGLFRHERPFDFVLPGDSSLPIETGAQIVPYSAMRACLERRMRYERGTLEALRRHHPGALLHLESPAPPRDDGFVADALDEFRTLSPDGTVVGAALRYKLWRLHSAIVKDFCDALGITFVAAPVDALDGHGFLARHACEDATHANAWYGHRLLNQIDALVSSGHDDRRAA